MRHISFLCFSLSPFPPFSIVNIWMSQILCFESRHLVESFMPMCVPLLFTILLKSRTWYTCCLQFFLTMMIPPCPQPLSQPRSSINCSSFYIVSIFELFSTCQKGNAESFSWKEIDTVVKATWCFRVCQISSISYILQLLVFSFWYVLNNLMTVMM